MNLSKFGYESVVFIMTHNSVGYEPQWLFLVMTMWSLVMARFYVGYEPNQWLRFVFLYPTAEKGGWGCIIL